jgi:hypothetical protein
MPARARAFLFAVGLAAVAAASVEGVLRAAELLSPRARQALANPWEADVAPAISDPRLEYRPNPALRGHDANGFRNPAVPERSEILVLGDSQTYGTGVAAEAAWPRLLERLAARSTYSMAAGGYGPVHSWILLDAGLKLRPSVVIEALYAGNDFYDAYRLVYQHGEHPELRRSEFEETIHSAERERPIAAEVERLFGACLPPIAALADPPDASVTPLRWLAQRSRLYSLARRVRFELGERWAAPREAADGWQAALDSLRDREQCVPFESGRAHTVLTPVYRLAAVDPADPRIREGKRIALEAIAGMERTAAAAGSRFVVLLIPTKELVFDALGASRASPHCAELVAQEQAAWAEVKQALGAGGIGFIDLLGPLQAQLRAGPQPYQATADGHPNEIGHEVIARSVAAWLEAGLE